MGWFACLTFVSIRAQGGQEALQAQPVLVAL